MTETQFPCLWRHSCRYLSEVGSCVARLGSFQLERPRSTALPVDRGDAQRREFRTKRNIGEMESAIANRAAKEDAAPSAEGCVLRAAQSVSGHKRCDDCFNDPTYPHGRIACGDGLRMVASQKSVARPSQR
jgi:hypothetical protein